MRVQRWRRYGHDRLYVNAPAGERLGWMDVRTGHVRVEHEEARAVVVQALADYPLQAAPVRDGLHMEHSLTERPDRSGDDTGTVWVDLAGHRPGEAARRRAVQERQAAPVRSFVGRLMGAHTDDRAWRVGAEGEEALGRRLERLSGWRVLHSIPVGRGDSDIDHLVVGPGGVFTINTKAHRGGRVWVAGDTVQVNGRPYPYVRKARHEARRAERILTAVTSRPVVVRGIVAVICDRFTLKRQPEDGLVLVLPARRCVKFLKHSSRELEPDTIDAIYHQARRADVWTTGQRS